MPTARADPAPADPVSGMQTAWAPLGWVPKGLGMVRMAHWCGEGAQKEGHGQSGVRLEVRRAAVRVQSSCRQASWMAQPGRERLIHLPRNRCLGKQTALVGRWGGMQSPQGGMMGQWREGMMGSWQGGMLSRTGWGQSMGCRLGARRTHQDMVGMGRYVTWLALTCCLGVHDSRTGGRVGRLCCVPAHGPTVSSDFAACCSICDEYPQAGYQSGTYHAALLSLPCCPGRVFSSFLAELSARVVHARCLCSAWNAVEQ